MGRGKVRAQRTLQIELLRKFYYCHEEVAVFNSPI